MDTLIRAERGRWMQMVVADRDASDGYTRIDAALEGGRETCLGIYIYPPVYAHIDEKAM